MTFIHSLIRISCAVVRFCYHEYDYRPNWTPLSPITITYNGIERSSPSHHTINLVLLFAIYISIQRFQDSLVLIAGGHPLIKPTLKPPSEPSKRKCVGSIFLADVLQYKRSLNDGLRL